MTAETTSLRTRAFREVVVASTALDALGPDADPGKVQAARDRVSTAALDYARACGYVLASKARAR